MSEYSIDDKDSNHRMTIPRKHFMRLQYIVTENRIYACG